MTSSPPLARTAAITSTLVLLLSTTVDAGKVDKAESRAEISVDGSAGRLTNRTFEVINGESTQGPRLLLRKEVQTRFRVGDDPAPGQIRIDAWRLPRVRNDKPVYAIAEKGDEIEWLYPQELLTIRINACCASSGSRTIFNAVTGKMLLYANGGGERGYVAPITRGGQVVLLVGVHDDHGGRRPRAFPPYADGHMLVLVTAADATSCRQQLVFDFPFPSKTDTYVTSVTWDEVKAWSVSGLRIILDDQETLKGILKIEVSDKRTLSLPVSEGGIDASHVVVPTGITMVSKSPCVL